MAPFGTYLWNDPRNFFQWFDALDSRMSTISGNTGNLEFYWCSCKIFIISTLVHSFDLRVCISHAVHYLLSCFCVTWVAQWWLSELIISCSFTVICAFKYCVTCYINVHVSCNTNQSKCKNLLECNANMSWKSAGNLLGWICRHPGFGNRKSIQPVKSPLWQCRTSMRFQGSVCVLCVCTVLVVIRWKVHRESWTTMKCTTSLAQPTAPSTVAEFRLTSLVSRFSLSAVEHCTLVHQLW